MSPLNQYKLLIEVEQQDIGYVEAKQVGRALLTPIPNQPFDFEVSRVTPIAQAQEGKTVFRVEGVLQGDVSELRPGMEGIAKIETVTQPRIWNWTRKLWAWITVKVWVVMP
ncbi:GAF domain protein [Vibrio ponticus]|nr:GAF domain protein [Vibrio ponticus]